MKRYLLLLVLVFVSATSFSQTTDTIESITPDTTTVSAAAGPALFRAASPIEWDIIHTRVALSFDRMKKTATTREWIKLKPYFYATDTIELDAQGMKIDSVLLVGKKGNTPVRYIYEDDELTIYFDRAYKSTDTVDLYLCYTAMPYGSETNGSSAITDDRGLYFINTDNYAPHKPAHIWTQGETESNSRWMITIDKPNSRFTTQIELTVPDTLTTLSNGTMVKQVKGANRMRTDIWKMDMPIQAYAVMFAIGDYSVIKDKWRNKEVSYYVEPAYAPYARDMFRNTPEMMEFFSKRTGVPYPWNKYSQVVVRDYVSGAMENTTASLFGEFMNQTTKELADRNNEDIVAHELFHQWFGDYVTAESWSNLTVSESFANYGEQLWRRWKYGNASADELAWTDLQRYISSTRATDPQLVRYYYEDREDMFDAISYNKGGAILRYLNHLAGDAAFERAMQLYLTRNALGSAEAHHWRLAVEEATGIDWTWFFGQWYYHSGHPVLNVAYTYNDAKQVLTAEVSQVQEDSAMLYSLPLETAVIYGNEKELVNWNITKRTQTFTYPYRKGQRPVLIPDHAHVLPGEIRENKQPEQWRAHWQQSGDYVNKKLAVQAAGKQMADSQMQLILDAALTDSLAAIRRYAVEQIEPAKSDRYRRRWTAAIINAATNDRNNLVRAAAFDVLGVWKVADARQLMIKAVSKDSSYEVAGSALEALEKIDKDIAYILAKAVLRTVPGGALDGAILAVIGRKGADDDVIVYQKKAPYVFGTKRVILAASLNNYLKNVVSDEAFRMAAGIYADMVIYETMKSYRSGVCGYMFQACTEQKGKANDADREVAERATGRRATLKASLQQVIAAERDKELKKKFEKMMKENFE